MLARPTRSPAPPPDMTASGTKPRPQSSMARRTTCPARSSLRQAVVDLVSDMASLFLLGHEQPSHQIPEAPLALGQRVIQARALQRLRALPGQGEHKGLVLRTERALRGEAQGQPAGGASLHP